MPIVEHLDGRDERDHYLVITSVVAAAQAMLNGFEDWIEEELIDLHARANFALLGADRELTNELQRAIQRMDDIQMREGLDCANDLRTRIKEISNGAYDDVVDARRHAEVPCNRFENIVRELLGYRSLLYGEEG